MCHDYEGVMFVLCTPLQIKCYHTLFVQIVFKLNNQIYFSINQKEYISKDLAHSFKLIFNLKHLFHNLTLSNLLLPETMMFLTFLLESFLILTVTLMGSP